MIRDASAAECSRLSTLAFASKAHWGYDDAFMEACRAELTVRPLDLDRMRVRVAEEGGAVLGFSGLERVGEYAELVWLFVDPSAMGRGVGRALAGDALEIAHIWGVAQVQIDADPNAAPFYERIGARRAGEAPSASIRGRTLPVFVIDVTSNV